MQKSTQASILFCFIIRAIFDEVWRVINAAPYYYMTDKKKKQFGAWSEYSSDKTLNKSKG